METPPRADGYCAGDCRARFRRRTSLPEPPSIPGSSGSPPRRALTQLIDRIDRTDVLAVSAGPFDAGSWQYLGYKGGSEPGVVNMTLRLVTTDGTRYSVSATQNRGHHAVDLAEFVQGLNMVLAHLQ